MFANTPCVARQFFSLIHCSPRNWSSNCVTPDQDQNAYDMHYSLKSENVELRSQIKVLKSNYEKFEPRLVCHENDIKKLKDKK
jgi:hypothetical protein